MQEEHVGVLGMSKAGTPHRQKEIVFQGFKSTFALEMTV